MVNRGVPSNACTTCKIRRIRCDAARPSCQQCAKSKRFCLGYDKSRPHVEKTLIKTPSLLHRRPFNPLGLVSGSPLPPSKPLSDSTVYLTPEMERFLDVFTVNAVDTPDHCSNIHCFDVTFLPKGPGKVALLVLDVISRGYHSLRNPGSAMSIGERRTQFERYRHATQELRNSIKSGPPAATLEAPTYLFALYEMIVGDSWDDKAWQVHGDGLLAMINQRTLSISQQEEGVQPVAIAATCLDAVRMPSNITDFNQACHLLDTAKVKLRKIGPEMDSLFTDAFAPRKLDVQKLHVTVKKIFKNLSLLYAALPTNIAPTRPNLRLSLSPASAKCIEYRSLLIIMSDFLLKTGRFLHSNDRSYGQTKEFSKFSAVLRDSVDVICTSVPAYFLPVEFCSGENQRSPSTTNSTHTLEAIQLIWPLYCASKAPCSSPALRQWIQASLWTIGEQCSLPRAMALAEDEEEKIRYSDALAGITLASFGFLMRPFGR